MIRKFLSFATVGGILTLVSLGSNFICLKYFNFPLIPTYIGVSVVTILISFILNSKYTFKSEINLKNTIRYYTIYLSSMCIGAMLLYIFERNMNFDKWVYPFMSLPFTLSFNFFVSSKYLTLDSVEQLNSID